ncbi:hypothetical protein I9W82_001856 [Candida metapsilosis]|uniref:NTF2 domain-containing protein n=1 Tax=Candida metapsilosis TaxID=273372 RepID=A0A8H8DDK3_9ASCO|nr:hypothetical protein I9W82_001856 [Candida metapsilosis]
MTTSPTPVQEERKSTPNSGTAPVKESLSEERVSNIGWYFIKSYYDFYIAKLDVIHKIYHDNASILHDAFPEEGKKGNGEDDELTTSYKAQGTDAIKKCFAEHLSGGGNDNNRIVITSATFQVSLEKNIIIVTFGEWSKNDSPFKQFTQTFVLTPGKRESTYDVANDVLKFIESNGFKDNQEVKDDKEEVAEEKPVATEEKEEAKPQPVENAEPEKEKVEEEVAPETIEEEKKEPAVEEPKTEETPKSEPLEKEEESPKEEVKPEEPAKPKSPPQPMTWADLAYQAVPASKPASKPTSKPTTSASTAASTPTSAKKAPVAATQSTGGSGKFKKDEWYPIYIRGIRTIDEKVLKDHITKKFGELKFFRTNQNIALCDFVYKEAQRKALEAKETTLDGVVINLEPRESKTGNNFHNSNGNYKKKFGDKESGKDKLKGASANTSGKFVDGKKVATGGAVGAKQKVGKLNTTK